MVHASRAKFQLHPKARLALAGTRRCNPSPAPLVEVCEGDKTRSCTQALFGALQILLLQVMLQFSASAILPLFFHLLAHSFDKVFQCLQLSSQPGALLHRFCCLGGRRHL